MNIPWMLLWEIVLQNARQMNGLLGYLTPRPCTQAWEHIKGILACHADKALSTYRSKQPLTFWLDQLGNDCLSARDHLRNKLLRGHFYAALYSVTWSEAVCGICEFVWCMIHIAKCILAWKHWDYFLVAGFMTASCLIIPHCAVHTARLQSATWSWKLTPFWVTLFLMRDDRCDDNVQ